MNVDDNRPSPLAKELKSLRIRTWLVNGLAVILLAAMLVWARSPSGIAFGATTIAVLMIPLFLIIGLRLAYHFDSKKQLAQGQKPVRKQGWLIKIVAQGLLIGAGMAVFAGGVFAAIIMAVIWYSCRDGCKNL